MCLWVYGLIWNHVIEILIGHGGPYGISACFLGKYDEFSVNIWVLISKIAMPLKGDTVIVNHLISDSILQKLL